MNITLFELHLDDAMIAPSIGSDADAVADERSDDASSITTDETTGRSYRFALLAVGVLSAAAIVARRRMDSKTDDIEIELDDKADLVTVD